MIGPLIWDKPGRPARIKIDGMRDIKVTRAVSRIHAGGWVGITVELLAREGGERNEVVLTVPDETRDALVALGWTPPTDDEPEPEVLGYVITQGAGNYWELCVHGPDPVERTPYRLRRVIDRAVAPTGVEYMLCKLVPVGPADDGDPIVYEAVDEGPLDFKP